MLIHPQMTRVNTDNHNVAMESVTIRVICGSILFERSFR